MSWNIGPIWDYPLVLYRQHTDCPLGFTCVVGSSGTQIRHPRWAHAHSSPKYLVITITNDSHRDQKSIPWITAYGAPFFSPFILELGPTYKFCLEKYKTFVEMVWGKIEMYWRDISEELYTWITHQIYKLSLCGLMSQTKWCGRQRGDSEVCYLWLKMQAIWNQVMGWTQTAV